MYAYPLESGEVTAEFCISGRNRMYQPCIESLVNIRKFLGQTKLLMDKYLLHNYINPL